MGVIKINNIIYGSNNSADIIYKNTTVEEKLNSIPVFDPSDNANIEASYDFLTYAHIVNDLKSEANNRVLSAKQGKILNEKIDNINLSYLEDGIATNTENINTLNSDLASLSGKVNTNFTTLNNKVPFSFGIDANGNYGYYKDGADTVTPFKKGTYDVILVGVGEINSNYTTKVGYVYPFYENNLITYSTNNVSWSASATTNYITFTTKQTTLNILFAIDVQTDGTICTPYITGANYTITGGNMLATGTASNSYYRAKLTNITGTVTVGCKLSYGAMYTMLLMVE